MTMRRLAQQLEPFLHSVQRVPFVDLLVAAVFAIPTWLLAAVGGLATVYLAAGSRGDWSTTALLLAALAAGAAVAAAVTALTFIWMLALEIWRQWPHAESDVTTLEPARPEWLSTDHGEVASQAETESPIPARAEATPTILPAAPMILPTEPTVPPVAPVAPPAPRRRKLYLASELRSRLRAIAELSEQLDGPIQEAFDLGNALAMHIDDVCRSRSKQEIMEGFNFFKSFTEAAQKDLIAIVKKHSFPEIAEIGPWDCGPVVDKTGVLMLLIPVVPEQALRKESFSVPTLRRAGADWTSAVNGFGVWLADKKRKLAAQREELKAAQLQH
jgi:hypothetical protein